MLGTKYSDFQSLNPTIWRQKSRYYETYTERINNEIGRSQKEHSEKGLKSMLLLSLQHPVGNPLMESNVMEIYCDVFNRSWSIDR